MNKKVRRIALVLGSSLVALSGLLCLLQLAFVNIGQTFGAYGQYNRVLRVIRAMDDYTIVGHRVRRKLELRHIFHVEEFSVKIRDKGGQMVDISFEKETDDMKQKNESVLRRIVRDKFNEAVARRPPGKKQANKAPEPTRMSALGFGRAFRLSTSSAV